jgi:glycine betaine/proline transport system substrate-binding protein
MHKSVLILASFVAALSGPVFAAPQPASSAPDSTRPACQVVRFSDIGWTDVTATTAIVSQLANDLGYAPKITVLSVPVTYAAMKNRDVDVFMGNWMPSMAHDQAPFVADGSVQVVRPNLVGAKYTLATPAYTYATGLHDFKDVARFAGVLNHTIYGLEPGNDGDRHVLDMIRQDQFGLAGFKLVESSEQGMLAQVERAYRTHKPIVFLGWAPHPMNARFDMRYLDGGDAVFGPNYGGATIYTNVRKGYLEQCPNIGRLLNQVAFTLPIENRLMGDILDRHQTPQAAATAWIAQNPKLVTGWLDGVTTYDGKRVGAAVLAHGGGAALIAGFDGWVTGHKLPVGDAMAGLVDAVKAHAMPFFDAISAVVHACVDGLTFGLEAVPAILLIPALAVLAWVIRRSIPLSIFVAAALLFILNQGYWQATLETLSLVLFSALVSAVIGVPVGILAAHRPWLYRILHPVLDLMQTLPTFVYLIPTLVLFGLGVVPGLISTVIFALPAPIRLTHLGVSSTPKALLEAAEAFGATPLQRLITIELPSSAPTIVAGITQCIMLSLSMVVIAALVGAGGLGVPVVRALNTVQVGMGFEAGFAIVLLAIILDRVTRPSEKSASR